jgi:hypothetical protein
MGESGVQRRAMSDEWGTGGWSRLSIEWEIQLE